MDQKKNVWHDVDIGHEAPKVVNMIVEIPKDGKVKYELDKKTGLLKMDRMLYSAVHYPGNYGFIPKTLWDDKDPLDIFVFANEPIFPMTLCEVRVIGVLKMIDEDESDFKILAVHDNDPRFREWRTISSMPQHYLKEISHFFETYKELQHKKVKVFEIKGPRDAYQCIKKAQAMYEEKYGKKDK